jgi:hypothetical protein
MPFGDQYLHITAQIFHPHELVIDQRDQRRDIKHRNATLVEIHLGQYRKKCCLGLARSSP